MNTKNNRGKRESREKIEKAFIHLLQTQELLSSRDMTTSIKSCAMIRNRLNGISATVSLNTIWNSSAED